MPAALTAYENRARELHKLKLTTEEKLDGARPPAKVWQWYAHVSSGDVFQVVGYHALSGNIDLKYFSGELKSIPENVWSTLEVELRYPPEDWIEPVY